jgi:hypothetical protein
VERMRKWAQRNDRHRTNEETGGGKHGVESIGITWADSTGGDLCKKIVNNRLQYGAGRKQEAHADKRPRAQWPSPCYEPRRDDKLRRGLYEREDDDWDLDAHVMCDDLLPTET